MAFGQIPCAASSLLGPLLDGGPRRLAEEARTGVSVHYSTGHPDLPVLTVCTPAAVRLPNSLVADVLPPAGPARSDGGRLVAAGTLWRVSRWWLPPRPAGLPRPGRDLGQLLPSVDRLRSLGVPLPDPSYRGLSPADLVGAGPGLTPAGDDVLAGALVAAPATDDPRLAVWREDTQHALTEGRTTVVSRAMLHHALDGYAISELATYLTLLCNGDDVAAAAAGLAGVGHSSGTALMTGALHTLGTYQLQGAA